MKRLLAAQIEADRNSERCFVFWWATIQTSRRQAKLENVCSFRSDQNYAGGYYKYTNIYIYISCTISSFTMLYYNIIPDFTA